MEKHIRDHCAAFEKNCTWDIQITVNVYELNPKLGFAKAIGYGVFHTAVILNDEEIAFGGGGYDGTGVYFTKGQSIPEPA